MLTMQKMKNTLLMMLFTAGIIFSLASCNDDNDNGAGPVIGTPTINVSPNLVEQAPGGEVEFTITAKAATGASVVSVTAHDGTSDETVSGGTYTYSIPADAEVGATTTITFTVADDQEPAKTATATANIIVSETPGQDITVTNITESTTWEAKNTYFLDGLVYVENNAVLTIEPGTIIKGMSSPATGDNTSSLIITRGAKIIAEGTAVAPIVFTTDIDESTLSDFDNSLWGGLILLGKAPIFNEGSTEGQVEGISTNEPRARYGGDDPDDDSGILKYVSIRFSGAELSTGNEIQGLTLGAVGASTVIDYIEIFASSDDGIEFFGGTVDVKHAAIAFAEDDSFDWDIGWRGQGQFWFAIQREDVANHAGEWDGAIPDAADLFSNPEVFNATLIGSGAGSGNTLNSPAILMRDGTAGTLANSIITDYNGKGIEVEDLPAASGLDAYQRLKNGELNLSNNIWYVGGKTALDASENGIIQVTADAEEPDAATLAAHLSTNMNEIVDPGFAGISRTTDGGLNPVPDAAVVSSNLAEYPAGLEAVNYKGAFDPNANLWIAGWTALSQKGYISE